MTSENESSRDVVTLRDLELTNYFVKQLSRWRRIKIAITSDQPNDEETRRSLLSGIIGANVCVAAVPENFMELFRSEMRAAEDDVKRCLETYVPSGMREQLQPLSISDMDPLTALNELTDPESTADTRRRFEILRALELTIEYAHLSNQIGSTEQHASVSANKRWTDFEQSKITAFLCSLGMGITVEVRDIHIYLNPDKQWRCERVCWASDDTKNACKAMKSKGLVRIVERVYAIAKDNPEKISGASALTRKKKKRRVNNNLIWAIIQGRRKGYFEAFAKRFRCAQSQFSFPADLFGFRIACFTERDMNTWRQFFAQLSMYPKRRVRNIPRRNKFAMRKLRLFSHPIFLSGKMRELQYIHVVDLANIGYSVREENRMLYHDRCYAKENGLYDQLWPEAIYGIRWREKSICEKRRQYVAANTITANTTLLK
jgi:hypothetical protein